MSRIKWDYAEVQRVATAANEAGLRMSQVMAERFGISVRYASRVISNARRNGYEIPTDLGWSKVRPGSGRGRHIARYAHLEHGTVEAYRAGCHCYKCRVAHARNRPAKKWNAAESIDLDADNKWPYDWTRSPNRACLGDDTIRYFNTELYDQCREVCARCPEVEPCRAYAIRHPDIHGLWGGLSERQRQAIRTQKVIRS